MRGENTNIFTGDKMRSITLKEQLFKYISKWPLFLICVSMWVGAGLLYIRYSIPKYMATVSFLINGSEGGHANSQDIIESALSGKRELNINNEMLLIDATSLMERTVATNGFNISYLKKGRLVNIDVYKDAPFTLLADPITDSSKTFTLYIKKMDAEGGYFLFNSEKSKNGYSFQWNRPLSISGQSLKFTRGKKNINTDEEYIVVFQPISVAAARLSENYTVKALDSKASVIQLTLKTENLQKGKDVLNALFVEFYQSDIEDRKKLSKNTVEFIDERLLTISGELKGVEGNLEDYQGSNQLVDIKSQSSRSLDNSNGVSNTIKNLSIQKGIAEMILNYFNNPASSGKLVPTSLGLNDATLSSLITQYNDLQLKKERETPLVAPNSNVMQDLNTQIVNVKSSILEILDNINRNLQFQENRVKEQNHENQNFLAAVPHNERVLQEIKRKQNITEGLYLYLLQKREEAAISSTASNVPHYRQIDLATGYGPVEPNSKNIILYTGLLGIFIALSWTYVRGLLNDKIIDKEDVTSQTAIPLIGQINRVTKKERRNISILDHNEAGEQFRSIRTNLSYQLKNNRRKIILVTSSISEEGKSFVSFNIAASYALLEKKVALLEFDMRKPVDTNNNGHSGAKGISDYLGGQAKDTAEIFYQNKEMPSLDIYRTGSASPNPADLLQSKNVARLFEVLHAYEYIIVDTAPAEIFSDAIVLAEYCDIILFVLRQRFTLKKHLDFIKEFTAEGKFKNTSLLLNDVRQRSARYHYDYRKKS